ncbi:MAG: tyrosine-type recombinase/integrase [Bacillota bacterium]
MIEYLQYREGEAEDYLFPSQYGGKATRNSIQQAIRTYNLTRGVVKTSIHLFRHTFAKNWIQNGGNIFQLQKILGHSSLKMVTHFL